MASDTFHWNTLDRACFHIEVVYGCRNFPAGADAPLQPTPSKRLRPALSARLLRFQSDIEPLPEKAVLLPEQFDQEALLDAVAVASVAVE